MQQAIRIPWDLCTVLEDFMGRNTGWDKETTSTIPACLQLAINCSNKEQNSHQGMVPSIQAVLFHKESESPRQKPNTAIHKKTRTF